MGVLLQGFYQRGTEGVPVAGDGGLTTSWWDHLAAQAEAFAKAGFTAIWLPPVTKGASGTASVGYDVFDDYDVGSKHQQGTTATRYGTREQLVRCIAMMRANGLDVYADLVENQRAGGSGPGGFTFRYAGADGAAGRGRFPKNPDDFHPNVPQDPDVPGPDFSFGADLAPINGGNPRGSVAGKLIDSADWLTRSLNVQGFRLDDAKGQSSDFLRRFLGSKSMAGKFAVAEYFDANVPKVQDWIFNKMGGRASAFDFATRFTLAAMCDNRPFNMAVLDHAGLAGISPFQAVTFVENHDTDRSEPIVQNKILAYAYILTSEGYPCVFYKDYSTDRFCFGLKPQIDTLIHIHEHIADGATQQRFKDFDVFAYERMGGPHLLVGLNNNPSSTRTITIFTSFGANVDLRDYAGHGPAIHTDAQGQATITIPRNTNGTGYVCYSRPNLNGGFSIRSQRITQLFEGASDLDIKPAMAGETIQIGRVFCRQGTKLRGVLNFNDQDWTAETNMTLEILDPTGNRMNQRVFKRGEQGGTIDVPVAASGFHSFRVKADHTPATNINPSYTLEASYEAPATLS
jgi:alpha-amylase